LVQSRVRCKLLGTKEERTMRVRILVADQGEARFFDVEHHDEELRAAGQLSDPLAHLHDRDLKSDRPGRKFDGAPIRAGRRGATAHHGVGSEPKPRSHEAESFARRIGEELLTAQRTHQFDRLVVMAPPAFLGVLRQVLPEAVRKTVSAEIAKDLVHETPSAVRTYVPAQAFQTLSST
jgi:protein required for attachment to host cells